MITRLTAVAAAAATLAMGFIGVPTAAAEIEGPHFTWEDAPALVSGRQGSASSTEGKQSFESSPGTKVVCTRSMATGAIESTEATSLKLTVEYGRCKAFGFIEESVSPAHYDISAGGSVVIEEPGITIEYPGCILTVVPQTVASVSFVNEGKGIEQSSAVTGIKSTATEETTCKAGNEGTYKGNNYITSEGGANTLEWHAS